MKERRGSGECILIKKFILRKNALQDVQTAEGSLNRRRKLAGQQWSQIPHQTLAQQLVTVSIFLVLLAGCTKVQMLPYLDQALTLQDMSREKDEQGKYVKNADAKFDQLWAAVESADIKKYKTEQEILAAFGPPVIEKMLLIDGRNVRQALYRYAIQSNAAHRVYFYYDENALITRFETI